MKAPTLNYEQLLKAKNLYSDISFGGFLINVANSFLEGKITVEEKLKLLEDIK